MTRRPPLVLAFILATAVAHAEPGAPVAPAAPVRDLDAAYRALVTRPPVHHLRNLIGQASMILSGTLWYWIDRERQVADWDYPSLGERLSGEAWRFDHNPFGINFIWHPLDGAGFHAIARANHLGLAGSALSGFLTSLTWEYLLEFREKISINDVLVTPGAGIAAGEFFHWLGRYLGSAPSRGLGHDAARWVTSPFHALDASLDHRVPGEPDVLDALGLSADIWHRFEVTAGAALAAPRGVADGERVTLSSFRAAGRLAALPGYLAPVALRRAFFDGNVSQLAARLGSTGDGLGLAVHVDTLLMGLHVQRPSGDDGVRALTVGLSLASDYRRDRFGGFRDRVGLLHLPGPALDLHAGGARWMASAGLRAHLDFGGLHALAYPAYLAANPDATEKEILRKQGYYYGWGSSGRVELELAVPYLALGGTLDLTRFSSIEGLDRNQELLDDDVELSDALLDAEAWLRLTPVWPWTLELRATLADRDSTIGAFEATQGLRTYGASLGAVF